MKGGLKRRRREERRRRSLIALRFLFSALSFLLCTFFILFFSTEGSLDKMKPKSLEVGATEAILSSFGGE